MTHETAEHAEAEGGPEHTDHLGPADEVPVADGPDDLDPVDHPDEWDG